MQARKLSTFTLTFLTDYLNVVNGLKLCQIQIYSKPNSNNKDLFLEEKFTKKRFNIG